MQEPEQGLPIPPKNYKGGRPPKYNYKAMKIGDSIFVPGQVATHAWSQITGFKFVRRAAMVDGVQGIRVFRVEGPNDA